MHLSAFLLANCFRDLLRAAGRPLPKDILQVLQGVLLRHVVVPTVAPVNHDDAHVGTQGHVRRQLRAAGEHEGSQAGRETAVDAGQHALLEAGNLPDVPAKQHHRLGLIILVHFLDVRRAHYSG